VKSFPLVPWPLPPEETGKNKWFIPCRDGIIVCLVEIVVVIYSRDL
jgi:hypothetical protein